RVQAAATTSVVAINLRFMVPSRVQVTDGPPMAAAIHSLGRACYARRSFGTCRIAAGSGDVGVSVAVIQLARAKAGFRSAAVEAGRVNVGSGLQLQKWQFGAHCPPDPSEGQSSSHAESPHIAARPLTSKVNSTRTARGTPRVSHRTLERARTRVNLSGPHH